MADWQEQLNSILSDPDAMAQIVSIAQSISGSSGEVEQHGSVPPPPPPEPPDPDALRKMLGGLDPELTGRLTKLMGEMNRPETGEASALLLALKPFLSEKRRGKVERAAQLARFIHLAKLFLTAQSQEGSHV